MEALNNLPAEILLSINAHAADWVSLESLLQVSPRIGELFSGDANTKAVPEAIYLVESILKKNPIMGHGLHRQFRMALGLRRPCFADTSLAEFMARDHSLLLTASPSLISPAMLKEMVIIAVNIQRLACACLSTLLARVGKVQPRRYEGYPVPEANIYRVTGTAQYEPRDAGPPSWIEEYRVYRALWHLQLYSDLSIAGARLNWPQGDLENWRTEVTDWDRVPPVVREELRTISECLESLYEVDGILRTTQSQVTSTDDGRPLISQLPNASQLRCSFDVWAPPSPPEIPDHEDGVPMDIWGQGLVSIDRNSMAGWFRAFQRRTGRHPAIHQGCSIQDARPWRGLGMPIWDLWRLYCLGLWSARYPRGRRPGPIPAPDGSEVPEGDYPFGGDTGLDYRVSVFMQARTQMEIQECQQRVAEERFAKE
ncbi:hypothetical protein Asppvi_005467 [Aspergillus pseudoviridinutans]|uniref:F-box domain-containing protein n=1 Tax=Aspergillus pseudoviridinutans TaxID=1517512 RepID=A0A9P3BCD0_9EURO|nr:uncharacterized protein Asppvi_005467 [Aspergillus pseudoviridinutans]GIJ86578.1 hypothetical protein Asppvi_005467 [Aspergillus pseudoviridinutans]